MNKNRDISRKHHFVPQFYLRTWHESDDCGFWLYFRNARGNISFRRRPANSVAYELDLYSFRPDGLHRYRSVSDELETGFFSPVDDAASQVYGRLMVSGINSLSAEDRSIWALFMNSLIERTPKRVREIQLDVSDIAEKILGELRDGWRSTETWPEMKAALDNIDMDAVARNAALSGLASYIVDKPFMEYVSQMIWQTFDLPEGQDHFLTSDSPVVINGGTQGRPIYILSIALSPRRLLVMCRASDQFDSDFIMKIVVIHNIVITKQANRYLVSSRELADSAHIKYTRIANEALGINE